MLNRPGHAKYLCCKSISFTNSSKNILESVTKSSITESNCRVNITDRSKYLIVRICRAKTEKALGERFGQRCARPLFKQILENDQFHIPSLYRESHQLAAHLVNTLSATHPVHPVVG